MKIKSKVYGIILDDIQEVKLLCVAFTSIKTKVGAQFGSEEQGEINKLVQATTGFDAIPVQFVKNITIEVPIDGDTVKAVLNKVTPEKYTSLGIMGASELLNQLREAL